MRCFLVGGASGEIDGSHLTYVMWFTADIEHFDGEIHSLYLT